MLEAFNIEFPVLLKYVYISRSCFFLFCSKIAVNIMEIYSAVIQIRGLDFFLHKKIHVPNKQNDSCYSIIWCVFQFLILPFSPWNLIKISFFRKKTHDPLQVEREVLIIRCLMTAITHMSLARSSNYTCYKGIFIFFCAIFLYIKFLWQQSCFVFLSLGNGYTNYAFDFQTFSLECTWWVWYFKKVNIMILFYFLFTYKWLWHQPPC